MDVKTFLRQSAFLFLFFSILQVARSEQNEVQRQKVEAHVCLVVSGCPLD